MIFKASNQFLKKTHQKFYNYRKKNPVKATSTVFGDVVKSVKSSVSDFVQKLPNPFSSGTASSSTTAAAAKPKAV